MWAVDAFFRPSLVNPKGWDLSSSEIVLGESLLISLCFLPVAGRVVRELRRASWRNWLALVAIAAGPQAFATVLFTQSLTYAFKPSLSHGASIGIQSEVYLLYLLQPVFGTTMAWLFLRERRSPAFWPLAALALCGATLIVFSFNAAAPRVELLAALYVLGAVVLWAAGTVLGRYALSGISFTTTSAMRFTLALPILLGLMLHDQGIAGFSRYTLSELPSFLGIALGARASRHGPLLPSAAQHTGLDLKLRRAGVPDGPLPDLLASRPGRLRLAAAASGGAGGAGACRRGHRPQCSQRAGGSDSRIG